MMLVLEKEKGIFQIKLEKADSFFKRFFGLMGRKALGEGRGMLLSPCGSIHTFFMKFTIDVLYLDERNMVLYKETIKPWRVGAIVKGTKKVVELRENAAEAIEKGDILEFR